MIRSILSERLTDSTLEWGTHRAISIEWWRYLLLGADEGCVPSTEDRFWPEKTADKPIDQLRVWDRWRGHQSMFFLAPSISSCRIESERVGQNPAVLLTQRPSYFTLGLFRICLWQACRTESSEICFAAHWK